MRIAIPSLGTQSQSGEATAALGSEPGPHMGKHCTPHTYPWGGGRKGTRSTRFKGAKQSAIHINKNNILKHTDKYRSFSLINFKRTPTELLTYEKQNLGRIAKYLSPITKEGQTQKNRTILQGKK